MPLAWLRSTDDRRLGERPVAREQRAEQGDRRAGDAGRAGRRAVVADHAAELHDDGRVLARLAAARAVLEARRPAGEGERPQQVGVEGEARAVLAPGERTERPHEQQVLLQRPLGLGELVGGLDHGVRRRVRRVVLRDLGAVGAERLGLRHDVERAALVQLQVGDHERLEPRAELRARAPHALRDRAHLAVPPRQQREDAVGLAQLVGAQHDGFISVDGHPSILPSPARPHGRTSRGCRARTVVVHWCRGIRALRHPPVARPHRRRDRRHPGRHVRGETHRAAHRPARRRAHRRDRRTRRRPHARHPAEPAPGGDLRQLVHPDRDGRGPPRDAPAAGLHAAERPHHRARRGHHRALRRDRHLEGARLRRARGARDLRRRALGGRRVDPARRGAQPADRAHARRLALRRRRHRRHHAARRARRLRRQHRRRGHGVRPRHDAHPLGSVRFGWSLPEQRALGSWRVWRRA